MLRSTQAPGLAQMAGEETDAVQFADDECDQTSGGEGENYSFARDCSSSACPNRRSKRVRRVRVNLSHRESSSSSKPRGSHRSHRHQHNHHANRRWKPYYKRSFEERKRADAKEVKRAHRLRAKMATAGQPLAPYNTTQFLMKDHELEYKDGLQKELQSLPARGRHRESSLCLDDEESVGFYYSSPSDEEEFVNEDFAKEYRYFTAERLSEMSMADLILECTELNQRIEVLEDQVSTFPLVLTKVKKFQKLHPVTFEILNAMNKVGDVRRGEIPMSREEAEKIMVIQRELRRVRKENGELRRDLRDICAKRGKSREEQLRKPPLDDADKSSTANNSDSGVESNYPEEISVVDSGR